MKLSIVVPAHNEEQRIRRLLDAYTAFFVERYGRDFELMIMVNGSTDRTADIAREYAARVPQVRVIVEPLRIGKGGALRMGLTEAAGDLAGYVDADASTPPEAFQDLVEHIGDAGAIVGSRWLEGSVVTLKQPLVRRLASRAFNALVRLFFRTDIRDTQCGAKVLTRQAVRDVIPRLCLTRWAFDVDLLFQLRLAGYKVIEHPTVWQDVSGSKLRLVGASCEMFLAILRLRLLHSPLRWIVTVYGRTIGRIVSHKESAG